MVCGLYAGVRIGVVVVQNFLAVAARDASGIAHSRNYSLWRQVWVEVWRPQNLGELQLWLIRSRRWVEAGSASVIIICFVG